MKKIGIIGAGIGGLTCAWRLIQKGIKTILFEKEINVGGRVVYSGAISSGKLDLRLYRLIKEFDLEELAIPLKPKEIGFFTKEGEILNLVELLKKTKKIFSLLEGLKLLKVFHFINSLNFDVETPDPQLKELREISFEEFLERYPPKIAQILEETACFFGKTATFNPQKISAEYGLGIIRLANELQSGKALTFEENNILTLTNVLAKELEEKGGQILTSAEVIKVEKEEDEFKIFYKKMEEIKTEKVEKVVLATPLTITKRIFPQLELETDIDYGSLNTVFVHGELKYPQIKVMKGNVGNPANFIILYNVIPGYQVIHYLPGQELNLEPLYYSWTIEEKKFLKEALPIIGPKAKVPNLKTKIKGAYLVGDFYYHTFMEVAVATAEMVAEMIGKEGF